MVADRLTPLQRRILVAEPTPAIAPPERAEIEGTSIAVDSVHEILVAKLTALLGRTEVRDLLDVRALLETNANLQAALRDAPKKGRVWRSSSTS